MEADKTSAAGKLRVFVSYSREDREFAEQLMPFLDDHGFDLLIDNEPSGEEDLLRARLQQFIASSDTVVFVLSPASSGSSFGRLAAETARRTSKRLICVLPRSLGEAPPPSDLADRQWIYFYSDPSRSGSGFYNGQRVLERALRNNVGWHKRHTEFYQLAERWRLGDAEDPLLWGDTLKSAQAWREAVPSGEHVAPLISDFLEASRRSEAHRSEAPRSEPPRSEAPRSEVQRPETHRTETPRSEIRRSDQDRGYLDRVAEYERSKATPGQRVRADEDRRKTDTWEYRGPPAQEPVAPVQAARAPNPPPIFDDLFEPTPKPSDRFLDDPMAGPMGDIFDDPMFAVRPREDASARSSSKSRSSAKSRKPAKSGGGGAIGLVLFLLIVLIGGGAIFVMYMPTMPNPFAPAPVEKEAPAPEAAALAEPTTPSASGLEGAPEVAPATPSDVTAAPAVTTAPEAPAVETPAPAAEASAAPKPGSDEADWQEARKANTLIAYRKYALRTPKGRYYDQALRESRRRIDQLSVHPESLTVILPGPVVFREVPTQDEDGRVLGLAEQDLQILDRITSVREGEWYVFDRGGPWPYRFVQVAEIEARRKPAPAPALPPPAPVPAPAPEQAVPSLATPPTQPAIPEAQAAPAAQSPAPAQPAAQAAAPPAQ